MSSQGPVRLLWPCQTSPSTCGKRVHLKTPHASLGSCKTKSHTLSPHPSTAGQPSGFLIPPTGRAWLTVGDFLLLAEPSNQCFQPQALRVHVPNMVTSSTPCRDTTGGGAEGVLCSVPESPWAREGLDGAQGPPVGACRAMGGHSANPHVSAYRETSEQALGRK